MPSDVQTSATAAPALMRSRAMDRDLLRHLSFVLADDGQREIALEYASRACELAPHDARAWSDRGCVQAAFGDWRQAVEQFSNAVARDHDFAIGWHNLGVALARLGDARGALRALRNAFLLADLPETCLALGHVLAGTGLVDAALDSFARAEALGSPRAATN